MDNVKIKRALVSVTDKTGVADFCRALATEFGVEIVSTGGTAAALVEAGIPVRPIDDLTGFPEMMDGRVKTLHPKVHGGLLARRDSSTHMAEAESQGIGMIDLVVVNLYAFEDTVAREGVSLEEAVENIDIGGPSMLRSAAKNFEAVTVVTDPVDYSGIVDEMRASGGLVSYGTRKRLATDVFRITSAYDSAIWRYLSGYGSEPFPEEVRFRLDKIQDLRYGENPHQDAAFYRFSDSKEHTLARSTQVQGKELSYNNILDTDACWAAVREFEAPACVIVKHMNPCGVAVGPDLVSAYQRAYECDPVSAYGGVIAFNGTVTPDLVRAIFANKQFVEVMIAPEYDNDALLLLDQKRNLRVLRTGGIRPVAGHYESRAVEGGMLVQISDGVTEDPSRFRVATIAKPTDEEMEQLLFAWRVVKSVKSNAIVLAKDFATVGVGAGQMNRVNSARIAVEAAGAKVRDSVCASDAFMPFPDTLEVCADAGVTAFIQPGGSIRDDEVIAAANKFGVSMVFTGYRHFRH
ncbi:bifunctional phosphoribosylaminoimidazolecarboxamide formyltransferase/IMP cyclohydrolase [Anaerosoma tenue]|uniref:bifunctional phosphoribosylaminoimidazolecarboxamide formyltransferase/IMP cyclohydrolase n=1 Tax=Anaerosoma tenue TaxID=2933588 RepID=UPI002260DEAF|nr:bifunctional phosphoribosylaminoimidazolecarboxamide formyltransferase/IMP cyclohydrolase [Anaerosoma tenue]MCK8115012.1 bifunctional phosphoribosylaminoimidazolecarboxamide formyltransferase/IMP cyclohydrolase [Anaerosoma tenue]